VLVKSSIWDIGTCVFELSTDLQVVLVLLSKSGRSWIKPTSLFFVSTLETRIPCWNLRPRLFTVQIKLLISSGTKKSLSTNIRPDLYSLVAKVIEEKLRSTRKKEQVKERRRTKKRKRGTVVLIS
jgi:hypothetical protein